MERLKLRLSDMVILTFFRISEQHSSECSNSCEQRKQANQKEENCSNFADRANSAKLVFTGFEYLMKFPMESV